MPELRQDPTTKNGSSSLPSEQSGRTSSATKKGLSHPRPRDRVSFARGTRHRLPVRSLRSVILNRRTHQGGESVLCRTNFQHLCPQRTPSGRARKCSDLQLHMAITRSSSRVRIMPAPGTYGGPGDPRCAGRL